MTEREIVEMMRENAALCGLEAEVIKALKYFETGHANTPEMAEQVNKIYEAVQTIDIIRSRNAQQAN
jgi:hypothetical protein